MFEDNCIKWCYKEVNDISKIKQDTVNIQTYVDKFTIVRDILDELYEPVTCN